jgi:hypothetical protein
MHRALPEVLRSKRVRIKRRDQTGKVSHTVKLASTLRTCRERIGYILRW